MSQAQDLFQLVIERDGINHVKVLKKSRSQPTQVVWAFPLLGDDEPIILKAFYTATKFVIINWNGWIRAFDIEAREKIFDRNMCGAVNSKALFSLDKKKLYIINRIHDKPQLSTFQLEDFTELRLDVLPNNSYAQHLQIREDGALLMYFEGKERTPEGKVWRHGYNVLNPDTLQYEAFELPYPQMDDFEAKSPVINPSKNLGLMPYWGDIEIKEDTTGKTIFVFKIMVFDLKTFEVVNVIPVRNYLLHQLDCYESGCEDMAEAFSAGVKDDEYEEALVTFCQDLNTIYFTSDEEAWLCWRGGIVRRVNPNGQLSPLLVASSVPGTTGVQEPFGFSFFHSELIGVDADCIIMGQHDKRYKMDLRGIDLASREEIIAVPLSPLVEEKTESSPEVDQFLEQKGKVVVEVLDLDLEESHFHALDQVISLASDIAAIGCGTQFALLVKDQKGQNMDDQQFFHSAIKFEGAAEKIKTIIENFIQYPKADRLYINEEETALCYAAYELARLGPAYFETIFQYLSVIDEDHDVFQCEVLLPMLLNAYRGTEYEKNILSELSKVSNGRWIEGFDFVE